MLEHMARSFDYILVGVGLQSALIALGLAALRPGARVALVERAPKPLGNHTWCFHEGDLPPAARAFVAPAVAVEWPRYRVHFPSYERELAQAYAAVTVGSLSQALEHALARLDAHCFYARDAVELSATSVLLDDGTRLEGSVVIDARGPVSEGAGAAGFQKFLGLELRLHQARRLEPIVMDATVEQLDGFRFVYVLPLAPDRVLIEDTYYAREPALDVALLEARVLAYAREHGFQVAAVERRETGVLPLPRRASVAQEEPSAALRAGYRGGFFHPVTGYSFPLAARLALALAQVEPSDARGASSARARARAHAVRPAI